MSITLNDLQRTLSELTSQYGTQPVGDAEGKGATDNDVNSVPPGGGGGGGSAQGPSLPPPLISPAAMMIALQGLNSKIAETTMNYGETVLEGSRKDLKQSNERRVKKLEEHFENLEKSAKNKKCGFFGAIFSIIKALVTFDYSEVDDLMKNSLGPILKDIGTIIGAALAIAVAAVATVGTAGAAGPALGLAIAGAVLLVCSMVMSDPAITEAIVSALPDDQKQAATLALMITSLVVGIVSSGLSLAAGGAAKLASAGMRIASAITDITTSIVSAGVSINDGVQEYMRSGYEQDALKNEADLLRMDAFMERIKTDQTTYGGDLKALAESFAKIAENTMSFIKEYGELQNTAAKA